MEENKFEKQVQQKMDELQIQPSDAVWKKIEVRIEKKKDRKWGLIILFLFTGLAISGAYWLWNARQQRLPGNHTSIKSASLNNTTETSSKENETVQLKNSEPESVNQKENQPKDVAEKNDINKSKSTAQHYKLLNNPKANQKINPDEKTSIAFFKEKKLVTKNPATTEPGIISGQSSDEQIENRKDKELKDSSHEKINSDSLSKPVTMNAVKKNSDTSNKKQATTATVKQLEKNKWKFGILFSGGLSGVGNNFLALNNSLPAGAYSTSVNQSPAPTLQLSPSLIKSGFGFIAGAFSEKNISKKSTFTLGINFKSFNTSIKLYDSSGTYSARFKTNNYINHFNFIEVPVSIKIKIGKGKNIPLVWQGGFVVSELISSNALQINSYTGYYYHDNSIFNKTQIGFNTALLASLFSKQKTSILIGPYLYYNASKIANEGLYNKKHFVFTGLHAEIIFGK